MYFFQLSDILKIYIKKKSHRVIALINKECVFFPSLRYIKKIYKKEIASCIILRFQRVRIRVFFHLCALFFIFREFISFCYIPIYIYIYNCIYLLKLGAKFLLFLLHASPNFILLSYYTAIRFVEHLCVSFVWLKCMLNTTNVVVLQCHTHIFFFLFSLLYKYICECSVYSNVEMCTCNM